MPHIGAYEYEIRNPNGTSLPHTVASVVDGTQNVNVILTHLQEFVGWIKSHHPLRTKINVVAHGITIGNVILDPMQEITIENDFNPASATYKRKFVFLHEKSSEAKLAGITPGDPNNGKIVMRIYSEKPTAQDNKQQQEQTNIYKDLEDRRAKRTEARRAQRELRRANRERLNQLYEDLGGTAAHGMNIFQFQDFHRDREYVLKTIRHGIDIANVSQRIRNCQEWDRIFACCLDEDNELRTDRKRAQVDQAIPVRTIHENKSCLEDQMLEEVLQGMEELKQIALSPSSISTQCAEMQQTMQRNVDQVFSKVQQTMQRNVEQVLSGRELLEDLESSVSNGAAAYGDMGTQTWKSVAGIPNNQLEEPLVCVIQLQGILVQ